MTFTGLDADVVCPPNSTSEPPRITVIETIAEQPVDENHPGVVNLVSAGYTVDESIDAMDRCRTEEAALTYLGLAALQQDDEGEANVIPLTKEQPYSRENSHDNINW